METSTMSNRIQNVHQRLVEQTNAALDNLRREVRTQRANVANAKSQADERAKSWRKDPNNPHALPRPVVQAQEFWQKTEKRLLELAQKAAQAIFSAESEFSKQALQALSNGASANDIVDARAAADAVLRLSGSELRGHGFLPYSLPTSALNRLIALAEQVPAGSARREQRQERRDGDRGSRAPQHFAPAAPRPAPSVIATGRSQPRPVKQEPPAVERKPETRVTPSGSTINLHRIFGTLGDDHGHRPARSVATRSSPRYATDGVRPAKPVGTRHVVKPRADLKPAKPVGTRPSAKLDPVHEIGRAMKPPAMRIRASSPLAAPKAPSHAPSAAMRSSMR
jgi:hypothetical protein